jgi:hypothetical protein
VCNNIMVGQGARVWCDYGVIAGVLVNEGVQYLEHYLGQGALVWCDYGVYSPV